MNIWKIIGILGMIVLGLSSVVHLLTYRNINLAENYPVVWVLFPTAIAIFIFTIITIQLKISKSRGVKSFLENTLARMPVWTWILLFAFFSYFAFSLFRFGLGLDAVLLQEVEGKYIINNHGQITAYTLPQVASMKLSQLRSYSGFWIWLLLCSTLYLLTAKRRLEK